MSENPIPADGRERRDLAFQVREATVHVLKAADLIGVIQLTEPRIDLPRGPTGLLDLYDDSADCPATPALVPPAEPAAIQFVSQQELLRPALEVLAQHLVPMEDILSALGVDTRPWVGLAGSVESDHPGDRDQGDRNRGVDLLLEDDGYFGMFPGEDADVELWRRNGRRLKMLGERLVSLIRVLHRLARTVGPGAVKSRVLVQAVDGRVVVTVDGVVHDVTSVWGAAEVFRMLRDADGEYVPGEAIKKALGIGQFKPKQFKSEVAQEYRKLSNLIDSERSKGTRLLLPLPPE